MSEPITYARRLVKGSTIIFGLLIASGVIGLLLRMVLARSFLAEDIAIGVEAGYHYGLFYAVFALISLIEAFRGLGFDTALIKYIPEFLTKKRFDKIKSSIAFVLLLRALVSSLIAAVLFIFSNQIALAVFGTSAAVSPFLILVIWFILMSFSTLRETFVGFQNVSAYSLIKFFDNLFVFLLALLFVGALGLSLAGVASAYLLTALVTAALSFAILRRKYPQVFKAKLSITRSLTKKLSKFALPVFLGVVVGIIIGYMDTLMIAVFRTPSEVGYYEVAKPMQRFLCSFAGALPVVFFPMVSELWARREKKLLGNIVHFLTKFSFILIIPPALVFIAFPDILIRMFFGPDYLAGATVLQIFGVVVILYTLTGILHYALAGIGKPFINTKVVALMAGFNFVANLSLIPLYGIEGAAVATLGAYLIGSILLFYYAKKFVKFTVPTPPLLKTAIGGALTLLFIFGLKSILVLPPWPMVFAVGIPSFVFYGVWILATKAVTKDDLRLIARIIPMPKWLVKIAGKIIKG